MKLYAMLTPLLLMGCASTVPLVEYHTVKVFPPESLMQDCEIAVPPSKSAYMKAAPIDREKLMTDFAVSQTRMLNKCNEDKKSLRKWKELEKNGS